MTEEHISQSLFGENGILKRGSQTVVLATHAVHLLDRADNIILLGEDSKVVYQGRCSNLPKELIPRRNLSSTTEPASSGTNYMTAKAKTVDEDFFVPMLHPAAEDSNLAAPDTSRQMGDFKVYKYYLKTMGLKHTIIFAFLGAICMGFTPAQGKKSHTHIYKNEH